MTIGGAQDFELHLQKSLLLLWEARIENSADARDLGGSDGYGLLIHVVRKL
jgi:hypothetical protein